jgi:hypothetical protein
VGFRSTNSSSTHLQEDGRSFLDDWRVWSNEAACHNKIIDTGGVVWVHKKNVGRRPYRYIGIEWSSLMLWEYSQQIYVTRTKSSDSYIRYPAHDRAMVKSEVRLPLFYNVMPLSVNFCPPPRPLVHGVFRKVCRSFAGLYALGINQGTRANSILQ